MAKIYESKAGRQGLVLAKGMICFEVPTRKNVPIAERYGEFDPSSPHTQMRTGLTESQLIAEVEQSSAFKKGMPGVRGIWLKETRLKSAVSDHAGKLFDSLDEGQLRTWIANHGGKVPVNATKAQLIAAAKDTFTAGMEVKPAAPASKVAAAATANG